MGWLRTYEPVTSAHYRTRPAAGISTEHEHAQLSSLDHDEHIEPVLVLGSLSSSFPVLLPAKHTLFGPGSTEQRQLLIRNADRGRITVFTVYTAIVVLLSFSDDSMRKI